MGPTLEPEPPRSARGQATDQAQYGHDVWGLTTRHTTHGHSEATPRPSTIAFPETPQRLESHSHPSYPCPGIRWIRSATLYVLNQASRTSSALPRSRPAAAQDQGYPLPILLALPGLSQILTELSSVRKLFLILTRDRSSCRGLLD